MVNDYALWLGSLSRAVLLGQLGWRFSVDHHSLLYQLSTHLVFFLPQHLHIIPRNSYLIQGQDAV